VGIRVVFEGVGFWDCGTVVSWYQLRLMSSFDECPCFFRYRTDSTMGSCHQYLHAVNELRCV
jgi:hypothetical protein